MLRINEINVPLAASAEDIKQQTAKLLGVRSEDFLSFSIVRESLDCRRKDRIQMVYSVDVRLDGLEETLAARFPENLASVHEAYEDKLP